MYQIRRLNLVRVPGSYLIMKQQIKKTPMFKAVAVALVTVLLSTIPVQAGYAQVAAPSLTPGALLYPTGAFNPAQMVGLRIDTRDPFHFYFVMDKGDAALSDAQKQEEYRRIIKHFLVSLTVANKDMWVNLSPYESNRTIGANFGLTATGQDLLAQDYILKRFTASLMYPEVDTGRGFWKKVYDQVYEKFGTTDVPVDTFNKVWVRADQAEIYQKDGSAFLVKSHLKVMLEKDFLAEDHARAADVGVTAEEANDGKSGAVTADAVRAIIVPLIEKEVNEGRNFIRLRQIYNAMILATWYKKALRQSLLSQVYADKNKVAGVEVDDPKAGEKVYAKYLEAFKAGVFNYIKEEQDPQTHVTQPRKYFSGGAVGVEEDILADASQEAAAGFLNRTGHDIVDTALKNPDFSQKQSGTPNVDGMIRHALANADVTPGQGKVFFYVPQGAPADNVFVRYAAQHPSEGAVYASLDKLQQALTRETAIVFVPFARTDDLQPLIEAAAVKNPKTFLAFSTARAEAPAPAAIPLPDIVDRPAAFKAYLSNLRLSPLDDIRKVELGVAFLETQWLAGNDAERRQYKGVSSSSGVSGMADVIKYLFKKNKGIVNPNIVLIRSAYGGTDANLDFYKSYGLDVRYVTDPDNELEDTLDENTIGVIFESPNNPPLRVWDIEKIVTTVKAHAPRALSIFDGAFGTPAGQQPLKFGVDIVVQVVTKMLGTGNSFGTIAVAKKEIADQLEYVRSATIHQDDARRIFESGLPTFFERYKAAQENARYLAAWLKEQKDVVTLLSYPGDPDHPQFRITQRQSEGENYGNMIYFDMPTLESAGLFGEILAFLRTPRHSVSLGEVRTQVQLPLKGAASTMPEEAKKKLPEMGMTLAGVRVSVGCEDPDDIIRDFKAAFDIVRRFKGRENECPLAELREILMHPTVQPDGKKVEHVVRLYPVVRQDEQTGALIVEPRVERAIAELERRARAWPLRFMARLGFRKGKQKLDDTLASLRIIHEGTRIDRLSTRTLAIQSGALWNPLVNAYAVTPGGEESNAYLVQGPDPLKLGFGGPLEAGKSWKDRIEEVVSGLFRVYGRIGTANALVFENIVAAAEGSITTGLNQDVQGVSVPSLETAFNVLAESWALQPVTKERKAVRIAVVAPKGSALYASAEKFQDIYGGLFVLKGEKRVEFVLVDPGTAGSAIEASIDRRTDLVVIDEFLGQQDEKARLFRTIKSKAMNSRLAVVNSRGIKQGFKPLKFGADFVINEFTNAYDEPVAAALVTPLEWVTRFLARRTYTSIASRAAMLHILPTAFLGIPSDGNKDASMTPGGIDLDDTLLNIKLDGQGVPLPVQFQDPAMVNIRGLEPVIRSIVPMTPLNMPIMSQIEQAAGGSPA